MTRYPAARIADFCRTGSGSTPSRSEMERYYVGGTIPWVKSGELREDLITETEEYVTHDALNETSIKLVPEGAILLAMYGATVGRLAILGVEATTNQAVCHIVPDVKAADTRYLFHAISNQVPQIIAMGVGGAQPNISQAIIKDLRVPLPLLTEQRRIAAILDQADALRAKRREALTQLDSLTQSIFIEMFGDPVRNVRDWPTRTVNDLCELVRGSSPRPQGDPKYFGGPVPRLMVADITRDGWLVTPAIDSLTLEGAKRSRPVLAGTVVMAVSGNIGLVSRLAVDASVHDGFVAFTSLDESVCEPGYLLALLHFSKAVHEKNKAGAIFINLTTTDIKAMQIPLPPLALQREFGLRLNKAQSLRDAHTDSENQLDALFASLQHRAFRGEL